MPERPSHRGRLFVIVPLLVGVTVGTAQSLEVQSVVGVKGARSWLAESRQLPIVVLDFAFRGAGSATDPVDREGLATFGAQMLLEGAGDLNARTFQERLSEIGAVLVFTADRDALIGHLEVAREHRERAFDLLRLALAQPRFDADAIERVRQSRAVELARLEADPGHVARRIWWRAVFPNHPYGRDPAGSRQAIVAMSAADLRTSFLPQLRRPGLIVAAAGAIDARELAAALDRLFGSLPTVGAELVVPKGTYTAKPPQIVRLPFPQSACVFGQPGVAPGSAGYFNALVLNHLIGGGTLTSRLFVEMREKRGLVYSVRTMLETLSGAELFVGQFSTENAKVRAAIDVVESEWRRAAKGDVTDDEVTAAKGHLKGAFPISMDGTAAIAAKLLAVQRMGLDIDYIKRWEAMVNAVDPEAVRATARQILRPDILTFGLAGNPEGL